MSKLVREVALDALLQVEKEQAYSNLLLNQLVKKNEFSKRDVGLLTEIVYGTIQRKNTLDYFLSPFVKNGFESIEQWVHVLLRLSVYQMLYLDRVPERAIIHEAVMIASRRGHEGISGMVNGVLRSVQRQGQPSFETIKNEKKRMSLELSFPKWLVSRWIDQYGEKDAKAICQVSNQPPSVTIRVNRLKATVEEVIERLRDEGMDVERGHLSPDAIIVHSGHVLSSNLYKEGYMTIQDESSMLVARALDVQDNMHIVDACAAPGGKSTHIAERMNNNGQLYSLDLHKHKMHLIEEQANRLGLTCIKTKALDARLSGDYLQGEQFDRVLVDAPCSGLGVIRRKPDIKWSKKPTDISAIQSIQQELITVLSKHVKKDGKLLYSTCTIDKEENEGTVENFLKEHPQFELDRTLSSRLPKKLVEFGRYSPGMVTILPQDFLTDGFFIACFNKVR
ncbi:16S rRNA (cytosine(967)-C(5))-methyltransferase RsmB [Bacillus sp. JCM 19034]|uniref:16S rRNA (cytosine(967)-C(5))-methyltransferase RsmB n=1 Tax=Bacillus sp. JCM 19034 TaxID=1481928 RepID=UPI0007824DA8|nr:16S rRNA (cytosine(967)-C(5))-methyltransferase RsmB [Bacillus sp. JCM 19034]